LQALVLLIKSLFGLDVLRMDGNTSNRTHLDTLRLVKMTYTLRALARVNFIDFRPEVDRLIGTLRFTHIAIDAFVSDHQSHQNLT